MQPVSDRDIEETTMKKIIAILLLFTSSLLVNVVSAAEENNFSGLNTNMVYSISQLQELALNNSRQAQVDDADIKKKEVLVRTVRTDTTAMSDSIQSIIKPLDVALELDIAKRIKQDNLNQLKVDVYKAAMNVLLCEKELAFQEDKLVMAHEKLDMVKSKFQTASIIQNDLDSAQYDFDRNTVNRASVKEKLNSCYLDLRNLLNQTPDALPVKIKDDLQLSAFKDVDVNLWLNSLHKKEASVLKAAGKLELSQTAMTLAEKLYRKGDLTYDSSVMDLENAKLDLALAKNSLNVKVRNLYNDVITRLDNIELASKYVELTRNWMENAQTKYDQGTISKEELLSSKVACLDAEYARYSAIADFNRVNAEFDNLLGRK